MSNWTDEQLRAAVEGYIDMRERVAKGEAVNKVQSYRALANIHGKEYPTWALRFGNISHIMGEIGQSQIPGIKALPHVGTNVSKRLLNIIHDLTFRGDSTLVQGVATSTQGFESADEPQDEGLSPKEGDDSRVRILRNMVLRRGRSTFRRTLLEAYKNQCAISGCMVISVLEAAHIFPYRGQGSNSISNGLILRADLHTLFDLYLLSIDPDSRKTTISPTLVGTEYEHLEGRPLATPTLEGAAASVQSLRWHRQRCKW